MLALIYVLIDKSDWERQIEMEHLISLCQDMVDQDADGAEIGEDETLQEFQQFLIYHLDQAAT